jgi:hypothetical protein
MKQKSKTNFKTGMYLLETLTAGMYNEPLAIYREYIQNSVDSIDLMSKKDNLKFNVNIELDPFEKKIIISDNGSGLSVNTAEEVLCTLGSSNKRNSNLRGFRGIGRLGGIAFSNNTIFRTKAKGEIVESIQEWDCQKLRKYLADPKKSKLSLVQVIKAISKFKKINSRDAEGSYFSVTLDGVSSFRNYIFDLQKVMKYLSQIAPVNFNSETFSYGNEINEWLSTKLKNYGTYNIFLNDRPIYKPYQDIIKTNKKSSDKIIRIEKVEIKIKGEVAAYGWYGVRDELLGGIAKGEGSSGIRIRVGNILIGDAHILDGCFREPRFNSYVVGEIHVENPNLIPNSRRDDFIDNEFKTLFYNEIEKVIGLPISKEIRSKSRLSAQQAKPKPNLKALNGIKRKILAHSDVDKILNDIITQFGSNKEFEKILSQYNIH